MKWDETVSLVVIGSVLLMYMSAFAFSQSDIVVAPGVIFQPSDSWVDIHFQTEETFVNSIVITNNATEFDGVKFGVQKVPKTLPRAEVNISNWNPPNEITYNASSDSGTTVYWNLSGLSANVLYKFYVDDAETDSEMSNAYGNVSFSYSSWSWHDFNISAASETFDCTTNNNIGTQYYTGNCVISSDTTWGNGTLYMVSEGDITLGAPLTIWGLTIYFNQTVDRTADLLAYDDLTIRSGSRLSTNPENSVIRWDLKSTGTGDIVDIRDSEFVNGIYDFSSLAGTIQDSTFRDSDMTDNTQHMWIGPNTTLSNNYFDAIDVSQSAVVVVYQNWGETSIWGNDINFTCNDNNCMGIEVINMHESLTTLYPGFPTVEIAWNNLTFTSIAAGTDSAMLDFEYSMRLYAHNNTGDVVHAGQSDTVTDFILSGGTLDSIYENNTGIGKPEAGDVFTYCFYQFIYADTSNIWQHNSCDDVMRMAIVSGSGGATWAHNTMTNVSSTGWWMCETCGGGSGSVTDHLFYNNTFTYTSSSVEMNWIQTPLTLDDNSWVTYGDGTATQWGEGTGGPYHTVPGDGNFLYKAQTSIEGLVFANETDGDRTVTMSANTGDVLYTTYPNFGATDNASLSVEGSLDEDGSLNKNDDEEGTFLWQLSRAETQIDVKGSGVMYFNASNFFASTDYNASIWNYSDSSWENQTPAFTTDGNGNGSFTKTFVGGGKYNITITPEAPEWSNTAPTIQDKISSDSGLNNTFYSKQFNATDPDANQTLLWTLDSNASFLSVDSQNRTAWINGTPTEEGQFYVNATVADQGCSGACNLTDFDNYTLTINPEWSNTAPTIDDPLTTDEGGHNITYTQQFNATDPDANQTLLWTLDSNATFLSVDSQNRTAWVNGNPIFADRDDTYYVNLTVADQGCSGACNLTDYTNYTLWINDTAPVITNPTVTAEGGHNISYSKDFDFTDANSDIGVWSLNSNATFLDVDTSGEVGGLPAFADRDDVYYVNVTLDDYTGGLEDSVNYTLWLNNSMPYVSNGITSDTGTNGTTYSKDLDHIDNNTDAVSWDLNSNASFLSIDVDGFVNGTPDEVNTFYVNTSITDYSGSGLYNNYTLTVSEADDGDGNGGGGGGGGDVDVQFTFVTKGMKVEFTDQTEGARSWLWNFGDDTTSRLQNPTHKYKKSGTYIVTLNAVTPYGYGQASSEVTVPTGLGRQAKLIVSYVGVANLFIGMGVIVYGLVVPGKGVRVVIGIVFLVFALVAFLVYFGWDLLSFPIASVVGQ